MDQIDFTYLTFSFYSLINKQQPQKVPENWTKHAKFKKTQQKTVCIYGLL